MPSKDATQDDGDGAKVNPILLQGKNLEERHYLLEHEAYLRASAKEVAYMRYLSFKEHYMKLPTIVRYVIGAAVILVILILLPALYMGIKRVYATSRFEFASGLLLLATVVVVWRLWVRDL